MYYHRHSPSKDRKNYRKILGVGSNATKTEIRQAYFKKASKYHPDKNPAGGAEFLLIKEAFDHLNQPDKKNGSYDDDLDRTFDSQISIDQAKKKLETFFNLLFQKRGKKKFIKKIEIMQRKDNKDYYEGFLKSANQDEYSYQAWHYLQFKMEADNRISTHGDNVHELIKYLSQSFSEDKESSNELYGFTWEFRKAFSGELDGVMDLDSKMITVHIDIHLNDAKLLDYAIDLLQQEDSYLSLQEQIKIRLKQDKADSFAHAAQSVMIEANHAYQQKLISLNLANSIFYQTNSVLAHPTAEKIQKYQNLVHEVKLGKHNVAKIVEGTLLAFLGIAFMALGLGLMLTGIGIITGIPLKMAGAFGIYIGVSLALTGLGLGGLGTARSIAGKETGLSYSLTRFFKGALKINDNPSQQKHNEIRSLPLLRITY